MYRTTSPPATMFEEDVEIDVGSNVLEGSLARASTAAGLVIFAHGSGSSRFSTRNRRVAQRLQAAGFSTLLFDLLTKAEEHEDAFTGHLRFDIKLLADRLRRVADWIHIQPKTRDLPIGYFGASSGAAAALVAAARTPESVKAVVSRGGRPDLADEYLPQVRAATLLIVGGADGPVIRLNELALTQLTAEKRLEIIPGATHLFEEAGALEAVADLASAWFAQHLSPSVSRQRKEARP